VPPVWRTVHQRDPGYESVAMHVRPSFSAEKQKKANERLKARRAARRMCLLAS